MKLSTRARYALRMMVEIAKQANGGETVSLSQIAQSANLSRKYLEQLAISLRKDSLITGISGKGGGYILARPTSLFSGVTNQVIPFYTANNYQPDFRMSRCSENTEDTRTSVHQTTITPQDPPRAVR